MSSSLTIVQVTHSLGIGGVETYLCRLAAGLTSLGHKVLMLVQEPGVYAERARAAGAELVCVPFNDQGVEDAARRLASYSPDLIHAHNYRAARFASKVAAEMAVPYLMSVHGPRPWWKRALFRAWSDTVVTISEADRDNIKGPFGVASDRVVVSFLGVDTERFSPAVDGGSLRAELGIEPDRHLIVCVSRFSHRKALPAYALIDALPLVRQRIEDAMLLLVGDGPERQAIAAKGEALNKNMGRPAVLMVGARTDIPEVMASADVVVATANTALEAMASGAPTLAFGRTGYFGRITPDNFERAQTFCFGDHGKLLQNVAPERLADDLVGSLGDDSPAQEEAGVLATMMADEYNVDAMAAHIESIYKEVLDGDGP